MSAEPPASDLEAFRLYVRERINVVLPPEFRNGAERTWSEIPRSKLREWYNTLFELGGWSCPSWSKADGGPGWTPAQIFVFEQELIYAGAPLPPVFSYSMLGGAIRDYGTDDQKARYLDGLRRCQIFVCQGYSEPNAGSDLAALQCKAVRDGDDYIINGSKIWTSGAHRSDLMFGLFRTANTGVKQQGITFLLIDMDTPGIRIDPIITYEDSHEVNQVFFDDVRVPVRNRLGEEGDGWNHAKLVLASERLGSAEVAPSSMALAALDDLLRRVCPGGREPGDELDFANEIADVAIDLRALELIENRMLSAGAAGAEAAFLKIKGSEVQNRIYELTAEALGLLSVYDVPPGSNSGIAPRGYQQALRKFLNMRKTLIYSGSNEIQKNIIAKSVLGLR